jgi:hypothetical protein
MKKKYIILFIAIAIVIMLSVVFLLPTSKYSYGHLEVRVEYPVTSHSNDNITETLKNDPNITDFEMRDSGFLKFTVLNTTLSDEQIDRFELLMHPQTENHGFQIDIEYDSENSFSREISNDKEKDDFIEEANKRYENDKIIIDTYLAKLQEIIENHFEITPTEIDYGEIYKFEE